MYTPPRTYGKNSHRTRNRITLTSAPGPKSRPHLHAYDPVHFKGVQGNSKLDLHATALDICVLAVYRTKTSLAHHGTPGASMRLKIRIDLPAKLRHLPGKHL